MTKTKVLCFSRKCANLEHPKKKTRFSKRTHCGVTKAIDPKRLEVFRGCPDCGQVLIVRTKEITK